LARLPFGDTKVEKRPLFAKYIYLFFSIEN